MILWFVLLTFGGFWLILSMIEFLAELDELLLNPSQGNILFSIFFFFAAKSAAETVEGVLRDRSQKHYFSSPIDSSSIFYSKLLRVWFYNLLLFGIAMSVVLFVIVTWNIELPIDDHFLIMLYLLIILAPFVGFNISILAHLKNKWLKKINAVVAAQMITLTGIILHSRVTFFIQLEYTLLILVGSLLITVFSSRPLYREVWINSSQGTESSALHQKSLRLPRFISKSTRLVAEVEFKRRWRRKQVPGSLAVVVVMGAGLGFIYSSLGPRPDLGLGLGKYFYPSLISMTAFLAGIIHTLIPSLNLFSRDGVKLWCLRTLPSDFKEIATGKALAILLTSPVIILAIALPLPLILDYPLSFVLFSAVSSSIFIFLMSGIGLWAAAKFPNFNESTKGSPDIITMYSMIMLALLLSVIFLAIPFTLLELDPILGVLSVILAADLSALFIIWMFKRSSIVLENMELNF
ncbi:MAG: hypothetical protein KGY66_06625 [Candidatus Thermoplasmatota archaeon]|nr:hypothetical protein [Candidatus Thermoplasmatota archaeon]